MEINMIFQSIQAASFILYIYLSPSLKKSSLFVKTIHFVCTQRQRMLNSRSDERFIATKTLLMMNIIVFGASTRGDSNAANGPSSRFATRLTIKFDFSWHQDDRGHVHEWNLMGFCQKLFLFRNENHILCVDTSN